MRNAASIGMAGANRKSAIEQPTYRLVRGTDWLRSWLAERGIGAIIPRRATRGDAYPSNMAVYRRRNIIEGMFGKLKSWKRIADAIGSQRHQLPRCNRPHCSCNSMAQMSPLHTKLSGLIGDRFDLVHLGAQPAMRNTNKMHQPRSYHILQDVPVGGPTVI